MKNVSLFKKLALFSGIIATSAIALISLGASTPVSATTCVKGDKYTDFTGSYTGKDTMTVQTAGGKLLCNDVKVNFASFTAPDNYNGKGFKGNPTAIPQTQFYVKTVTLKKGTNGKTTETVKVPNDCTNYQIDAYIGAVQTKITTSAGLVGTNAIVGKLFQKTKSDCNVVTKVQACNTTTGLLEMVDKGKENTAPYTTNLEKCKVKACNTTTGNYEMVFKGGENTAPYTTNFDNCETTTVCNTETGIAVTVSKEEAKKSKYSTSFDKCSQATVCDTTTGKVVTVTKEEAKQAKYVASNDVKCNPTTPTTPTTIASTGPTEVISGIAGIGAVAGSGSMYIRSRRALRK